MILHECSGDSALSGFDVEEIEMRPQQLVRPLLVCLLLGELGGCAGTVAQPPKADLPDPAPAELLEMVPTMTMTCEVFCSEEKPRTAVAILTWRTQSAPASAAAAGFAEPESVLLERLDASVYEDGFESEAWRSFATIETGASLAAAAGFEAVEEEFSGYDLEIVDVVRDTGDAEAAAGFGEPEETSSAVIEGLEPGLNYTWRVVTQTTGGVQVSETVICESPVCAVDFVAEEEPNR